MTGENLQPRILYPARFSFKFEEEIKSFTDKQKLKEFRTTKPALQPIKGNFIGEKEKATTRNKKIMKWESSPVKVNTQ